RHREVLDRQTGRIRQDRETLLAALQGIEGITAFPSQANFLLFRVGPGQAGRVFAGLKAAGILIKNLDPAGGLLRDCLRVTVGTPEENAAFLSALREVL
ncbi:MAG TPA: aminotransferase class I/II-fold pyridoxal phosphate-dependent enzyme, partial [Chromatiales bacterium]|nr:aminotransferase class I/II-fold pyridoxal phosphate-dependent enzyme [Chromatiales bacterium]